MFTLVIRNEIPELKKIVPYIDAIAEKHSISEADIFDINLVIDEICSNIIFHSNLDEGESEIEIEISIDSGIVVIVIADAGDEFNPLVYETYDVDVDIMDKPIGNLGILLVKAKMDEVYYERKKNKNLLTMKKKLEN